MFEISTKCTKGSILGARQKVSLSHAMKQLIPAISDPYQITHMHNPERFETSMRKVNLILKIEGGVALEGSLSKR